MKELEEIVKAFDKAVSQGIKTALATVVHVEGSSYRRAGARMLIQEDGQLTGAISGGCLEGDALRKARLAMIRQEPMLVTYDTTDESDAKIGVGLGCNGIIHILIEPLNAEKVDNPINLFKKFLGKRQRAVIVTLFSLIDSKSAQLGTCLLLTQEEEITVFKHDQLSNLIRVDAKAVLESGNTLIKTYPGDTEITGLIELLIPSVSLLIFGAGNDAFPLIKMTAVLGWVTTVIDGRPSYASLQRFPDVKKVIVAKPGQALSQVEIDSYTVVVLMTHNYNYDLEMLRLLLPIGIPYIGCLGPRKRLDRMLNELRETGMEISDEKLNTLYGPTGLDIGADTSEEIALSILAEVQTVLRMRTGRSLRNSDNVIHNNRLAILKEI